MNQHEHVFIRFCFPFVMRNGKMRFKKCENQAQPRLKKCDSCDRVRVERREAILTRERSYGGACIEL